MDHRSWVIPVTNDDQLPFWSKAPNCDNVVYTRNTLDCDHSNVYSSLVILSSIYP